MWVGMEVWMSFDDVKLVEPPENHQHLYHVEGLSMSCAFQSSSRTQRRARQGNQSMAHILIWAVPYLG